MEQSHPKETTIKTKLGEIFRDYLSPTLLERLDADPELAHKISKVLIRFLTSQKETMEANNITLEAGARLLRSNVSGRGESETGVTEYLAREFEDANIIFGDNTEQHTSEILNISHGITSALQEYSNYLSEQD